MGLEAGEAVDDVRAGFLELPGPFDVIQLVEAGAQFDQGGHLLAVAGGFFEGFDDGRIPAGTIECELDRDDVFVPGRLSDEVDDGRKRFVGMVKDDVLLRDAFVKLGGVGAFRRNDRDEAGV